MWSGADSWCAGPRGSLELSTSEVVGCRQGSAARGKKVFLRLKIVPNFRLFLEGKTQSDLRELSTSEVLNTTDKGVMTSSRNEHKRG